MNFKIPYWINVILVTIITVLLAIGAIKSLMVPGTLDIKVALNNCMPAGLCFFVFITLNILLEYDLSTLMAFILIQAGLVIFCYGIIEENEKRQNTFFSFASGVFGLGSGIPIGRVLTAKKKSSEKT